MSKDKPTLDLDEIRARLSAAVEAHPDSMRKISQAAGYGPGYLHSILSEGKEPGISRLADICGVLGVSLSHVLYGLEITPQTEKIITRLEQNPGKRDGILQILED